MPGLEQFELEVLVRRSKVRAIALPAAGASGVILNRDCHLFGWAIYESTGSAASEIDVWDGQGTSGLLVAPITLSAGQSTRDWFGPDGIEMMTGIYIAAATGSTKGTVFVSRHEAH